MNELLVTLPTLLLVACLSLTATASLVVGLSLMAEDLVKWLLTRKWSMRHE